MNKNTEDKIEKLIEEALDLNKIKQAVKSAGLGAIGGAIGAGLDVYFHGGKNIQDYLKPLTAWAAGGAAGSLLQATDDKNKDKKNNK